MIYEVKESQRGRWGRKGETEEEREEVFSRENNSLYLLKLGKEVKQHLKFSTMYSFKRLYCYGEYI